MEEAQKFRPRFIRKEEIQALEIFLSYSNFETEYLHWCRNGQPDRHIWHHIKLLIDFLKAVKPSTGIDVPTYRDEITLVQALPYDAEEL